MQQPHWPWRRGKCALKFSERSACLSLSMFAPGWTLLLSQHACLCAGIYRTKDDRSAGPMCARLSKCRLLEGLCYPCRKYLLKGSYSHELYLNRCFIFLDVFSQTSQCKDREHFHTIPDLTSQNLSFTRQSCVVLAHLELEQRGSYRLIFHRIEGSRSQSTLCQKCPHGWHIRG